MQIYKPVLSIVIFVTVTDFLNEYLTIGIYLYACIVILDGFLQKSSAIMKRKIDHLLETFSY